MGDGDGEELPAKRIKRGLDGKNFVAPDPTTHVLDKKWLSRGEVFIRSPTEYAGIPCPFCKQPLPGLEGERGQVGVAKYIKDAFMVVPCFNLACIKAQEDRQERLQKEPKMKLYHAASRSKADLIISYGKFIRGTYGAGGGGIYMAHTPRETEWKAEESGSMLRDAVAENPSVGYIVLECEVSMGRPKLGGRWEQGMSFANLQQEDGGPYDSFILDRGQTGYPNGTVPDAPVVGTREGTHPGYEFVVYSWDQVKVLGETARDPVSQ